MQRNEAEPAPALTLSDRFALFWLFVLVPLGGLFEQWLERAYRWVAHRCPRAETRRMLQRTAWHYRNLAAVSRADADLLRVRRELHQPINAEALVVLEGMAQEADRNAVALEHVCRDRVLFEQLFEQDPRPREKAAPMQEVTNDEPNEQA